MSSENSGAIAIDRPYLDRFPAQPVHSAKPLPRETLPQAPIPKRNAGAVNVLACVAESYDLTIQDLLGRGRNKALAEARAVAYWMLREVCGMSFPEIGRVMGKDHTSAMQGVRKCLRMRDGSREFEEFTAKLARAAESSGSQS